MDLPENHFKRRLAAGENLIGCWQSIPGSLVSEALATCGFDWIVIDTEHSPLAVQDVMPSLQAMAPYPVAPVVRVLEANTALIKQALDIGAQTLMVPYVESADQARDVVAAMRYAPRGVRGMAGGTRATRFGAVPDYVTRAEAELALIVQVETVGALDQLDAIATLDGVDAVFIGPADLSASMGYPGQLDHPDVQSTILDTLRRLAELGVPGGMLAPDPDFARACMEAGSRFTAVGLDMRMMVGTGRKLAASFTG